MASSCAQVPKRLNHPCTSLVLHISLHAYWPLVGSSGMAQLGKFFPLLVSVLAVGVREGFRKAAEAFQRGRVHW